MRFHSAGAFTVLAPNETVAVALAHGFGNESGSDINPALVVASVVAGEHSPLDAVPVLVAQLLGGIAGAFLLETVGTLFLASIVLNTAVRARRDRSRPSRSG